MRGAGIEALDSRTFFAGCGLSDNDLNLKTDMHWTTLAALLATRIYAEKIEEMTGVELDLGKIDLDRFEEIVYPDLFLGEYAQQLGERNAGLDDITFYLPEYDTQFTRHSIESDGTEEKRRRRLQRGDRQVGPRWTPNRTARTSAATSATGWSRDWRRSSTSPTTAPT